MTHLSTYHLALALLVTSIVAGAVSLAARNLVVLPNFVALERQQAETDVMRCLDAILREAEHMRSLAGDWALWDDTYAFVQDRDPDFIKSNLVWESLHAVGLDLLYIADRDGRVVWGEAHDPDTGERIAPPPFDGDTLDLAHPAFRELSGGGRSGVLRAGERLTLTGVHPILTSEGKGPSRGLIVMARFLDGDLRENIADQVRVPFALRPVDHPLPGADGLTAGAALEEAVSRVVPVSRDAWQAYALLRDMGGAPLAVIEASGPRDIMAVGRHAANLVAILLFVTLMLVVVAVLALLWRDVARARKHSEETEALVQERTEELAQTNAWLEAAIQNAETSAREARRANEAKSKFLANMSHEIRTPMNGVIGMAELLLDTDLSAEQREFVETLRVSGDALLNIINNILDISKIESRHMELERIPFDVAGVVHGALDLLRPEFDRKGLVLEAEVDPDLPASAIGDPGRLRQVLLNLLGNALKFTESGSVRLAARLVDDAPDGARLRFQVADSGIGISAAGQTTLFESFSQVDTSTTRRYGGTGLGLAISQELVGLMGGRIEVESAEGEGSVFHFTLHFPTRPEPADALADAAAATPAPLAGTRVLLVDEDAASRKVVHTCLAQWECYCDDAVSHSETLVRMHAARDAGTPYHVAILDSVIRGKSGAELGRAIKADPELRDVALVMVTAAGQRGEVKELRDIGFAGYLVKPLHGALLRSCLESVLAPETPPEFFTRYVVSAAAFPDNGTERPARILLAEDNAVNRKVAIRLVERLGYQVETVHNGRAAVAAVRDGQFDLVLMDCQMPELDGFAATRAIRELDGHRGRIPVIALTAAAMKHDRDACVAAGMNDFVSKPIDRTVLETVLRHWLPEAAAERTPG